MLVQTEVNDLEFWQNIVGSCFETWSWWTGWSYEEGSSWEKPGAILLDAIDPDYGDLLFEDKRITLEDMAKAYGELVSQGYRLDPTDLDADAADVIVQQAAFGEVVYG